MFIAEKTYSIIVIFYIETNTIPIINGTENLIIVADQYRTNC